MNAQVRWDCDIRVPKELGFGAVLPPVDKPDWSFTMRFDRRHWTFKGDRRVFGFQPDHRMLYIGQAPMNANVFIALMPVEAFVADPEPIRHTRVPTTMSSVVARITISMVVYMLVKAGYSTIYMTCDYPDVAKESEWRMQTNIL